MADLISNGNGVQPVYSLGDGDMFGRGSGMLVFFLFFLLAWGGFGNNGWGFNNANSAPATQADVTNGFNYANINSQLGDINQSINTLGYNQLQGINNLNTSILGGFANINNGMLQATNSLGTTIMQGNNALERSICDQTNALNMNIVQTGNSITNGLANLGYATQNQACGINSNIESVKYQLATEACATRAESDSNTQRILDKLSAMQMSDKDNQIAALQTALLEARNQIDNANQTQNLVNALKPYPVPAYPVSSPYASTGCGCTVA